MLLMEMTSAQAKTQTDIRKFNERVTGYIYSNYGKDNKNNNNDNTNNNPNHNNTNETTII